MLTVHALSAGPALLVGSLAVHRRGAAHRRPYLTVRAWCSGCRDFHHFPWPEEAAGLEAVETTPAPCRCGPFAGSSIAVGLDPDRNAEHRRTLDHFRASLRRWRVERDLSRRLAISRSRERAYLREWPELAGGLA